MSPSRHLLFLSCAACVLSCDTIHLPSHMMRAAGNICAAGLLQDPCSTVCMELGAGKAWLSAWLHMLHPGTREFVLLDRLGNFANKVSYLRAWFLRGSTL